MTDSIKDMNQLISNGSEWSQTRSILEEHPHITHLRVFGDLNLDFEWIQSTSRLESLSLSYLHQDTVQHYSQNERILSLLESGLKRHPNTSTHCTTRDILQELNLNLGIYENRWIEVLKRMAIHTQKELCGISLDLVYCPIGSGWVGEKEGDEDDSLPYQEIQFTQEILIGKTVVTQEMWNAVLGSSPSFCQGDNQPVESVSWFDCVLFCNELSKREHLRPAYVIGEGDEPRVEWNRNANGYRLPTEQEWEWVARAGTQFEYAGSNQLDEVGWYETNGDSTSPVACKQPNAWGLYDLSGLVWEWCHNPYEDVNHDPYFYNSEVLSRPLRGGSWVTDERTCRITCRNQDDPNEYGIDVGFRILRSRTTPSLTEK